MSRHAARRAAVQLVYEWMLGGDGETTLTDLIEFPQDDPDIGYLDILVAGVRARKAELEQAIAQRSESWTVDRIPNVVKAILYVALVECLRMCPTVWPSMRRWIWRTCMPKKATRVLSMACWTTM